MNMLLIYDSVINFVVIANVRYIVLLIVKCGVNPKDRQI